MPNIRIKDIPTTASATSSTDFIGIDGSANGTRKLNAFSPTFGGNLTVSGTTSTITLGSTNTGSIAVDSNGGLTVTGAASGASAKVTHQAAGASSVVLTGRVASGNVPVATLGGTTNGLVITDNANYTNTLGLNTSLQGNLTVSGTGTSSVAGKFYAAGAATSPGNAGIRADTGYNIYFRNASTFLGSSYPGVALDALNDATTALVPLALRGSSIYLENGDVLIGKAGVNSGNGKLQLATHTTSAGGIGFGTDTSLYCEAAGTLSINHSGGDSRLYFYNAGTAQGRVESASSNFFVTAMAGSLILRSGGATTALTLASNQSATFASNVTANGDIVTAINYVFKSLGDAYLDSASTKSIFLRPAGTTALTLDSSQRCILAGALRLNNAYTAGAPTATGYVTLQDSAGNTYKVLVGT